MVSDGPLTILNNSNYHILDPIQISKHFWLETLQMSWPWLAGWLSVCASHVVANVWADDMAQVSDAGPSSHR